MRIELTVDPDLCIGSGECVRLVPQAFELDEASGVSHPLEAAGSVAPALLEAAARNCPTQAIGLTVDGTVVHRPNG